MVVAAQREGASGAGLCRAAVRAVGSSAATNTNQLTSTSRSAILQLTYLVVKCSPRPERNFCCPCAGFRAVFGYDRVRKRKKEFKSRGQRRFLDVLSPRSLRSSVCCFDDPGGGNPGAQPPPRGHERPRHRRRGRGDI